MTVQLILPSVEPYFQQLVLVGDYEYHFLFTFPMAERRERWLFTNDQLANSPSRNCGIDSNTELSYRQQAACLISDMGQKLDLYAPFSDCSYCCRRPRAVGCSSEIIGQRFKGLCAHCKCKMDLPYWRSESASYWMET